LENAVKEAVQVGAETFQIFSASPRMWAAAIPSSAAVGSFQRERARHGLWPVVIHDNYLINLASCDETIRFKSIQAFRGEIARALLIGAEFLVFHPGNFKNQSVEAAIGAVADGIAESARGLRGPLTLLIENTAGQGASLGSRLEELAEIRTRTQSRVDLEIGYCIDTCHSLAAGYPLATEEFMQTVDGLLGWQHVPVIHANDSKGKRGSHLDRHEHIGEGEIGLAGFSFLVNHPLLADKAFILETPVDEDGDERRNLQRLRELVR